MRKNRTVPFFLKARARSRTLKMPDRIKIGYSEAYAVDIGNHVFPTSKYKIIRKKLLQESHFLSRLDFLVPEPAPDEDILSVHIKGYLDKLKHGTFTREEILRLELPYSKELVRASLLCCGGTILTAKIALESKLGIHLGGGFHHAFPDHGEGFCILNDIAVAVRHNLRKKKIRRSLIVDCDLHQGNGTAAIFASDPDVFTFSIHQENNYPFFKPKSGLDIGLPDRSGDDEYMTALENALPKIMTDFKPDLMVYVAGADPFEDDQIGGLALTKRGLSRRDEFVFKQAMDKNTSVAVVLAGGYAFREEDTVDIHFNTIKKGIELFYAN